MAKNVKIDSKRSNSNLNGRNQYFNLDEEKAFFEEVDEEVRNEKFKHFLNKYGGWLLAILIIALSIAVGYEKIGQWRIQKAEQRNVQYMQALSQNSDYKKNISDLEAIVATEKGLYKDMASLQIANILIDNNQIEKGLERLENLHNDENTSDKIKDIAAIKLATYKIDASSFAEVEKLLANIANDENNTWEMMAMELLAMSAIQNKNLEKAKSIYSDLLNHDISAEFRARINDMLASISDVESN